MAVLVEENFRAAKLDPRLQWFCEPAEWSILADPPALAISTGAHTDFWQRTHYGFQADNGHFLWVPVDQDFRLETQVEFEGVHQYDQAGLLVRFNPDCWLKASVEYEPHEPNRLGAVVTRHGYSDWSTQDVAKSLRTLGLRITREGQTFQVEAAMEPGRWTQIRLAHLDEMGQAHAGIYACSPKGAGFRPRFQFLRVKTR